MAVSRDLVLALVPVGPQASPAAEANFPAPGGGKKSLLTKAHGPVPDGTGGPPCVTEVEWVDRAISHSERSSQRIKGAGEDRSPCFCLLPNSVLSRGGQGACGSRERPRMQGEAKEEGRRQRRQGEAWRGVTLQPLLGTPRSGLGIVYVELALSPNNLARGAEVLISLPSWKLRLQWDLPFTLAGRGRRGSRVDLSLSLCCPHVVHSHLSQSPRDLGWDHSPEPIVHRGCTLTGHKQPGQAWVLFPEAQEMPLKKNELFLRRLGMWDITFRAGL